LEIDPAWQPRAAAACVEAAGPSSFPGAARSRCCTYPARIAAGLAYRDLHLLEERLRLRIYARPAAAGSTRPDPKIFACIPCHGETIAIGTSSCKSCRASIVSNRIYAYDGE
jgi:hypothetical protein